MSDIDKKFQNVVDREIDRLSRLPECELMKVHAEEKVVVEDGDEIPLSIVVQDFTSERNIGVIAVRNLLVGHKKFMNGIIISCAMNRMSNEQAEGLYD